MNSLFRSIRTQLLVLVMISVLPALGIILYSGLTIQQKDIARAESDVLRVLNSLDDDHGRIVDRTRQFLLTLARFPEVQKQDAKACNMLFVKLLKENPLYANIFSATAAGIVFSNARPFTPHSIRDRKYYQDVLRTKDFSVGEYVIGATLKQPVLHFAYPVRDAGGGFKGMVVVAIDLNRYGPIFPMEGLPPGSRLNLSDHKNRVLYRYPDPQNHMGRVDNPDMIRNLSSQLNEGTFTGSGNDGIKCLYGYKKFYLKGETSPYFFLRVGIPEVQALSHARSSLVVNLALLGGALLIAMVLAWFLGRQLIVQRLRRLVDAAKTLGHGDLQVRTGLKHSQDELGLLIKAFDEMAGELEDKEAQRKSAQAALRESEERYKYFVEKSFAGVYVVQEGIFMFLNDNAASYAGYKPEELIGRQSDSLAYHEDLGKIREKSIKLLRGENSSPYEFRIVTKDGQIRWIMETVTSIQYNGRRAILGNSMDITERKRAEEALKESEERWKFALEGAGDGLWDWDAVTNRVYYSRQWKAMLGYTEEDVDDTLDEWDRRIHPEDKAAVYTDLERHFRCETEIYLNEHRVLCKDDSYKWIMDRGKVIEWTDDGKPRRVIGIHTDITERKRMEAALQKSEVNYRQLFDNAPAAIYQIDFRTGKFTKANDVICEYLGYSQEEITSLSPYDVLTHESKRLFSERLKKIGLGEKVIENPEYELVDRIGKRRWLQLNSKYIYNAEGLVTGADVVAHEITERKQTEVALRESERKYRNIYEDAVFGIYQATPEGRFISANTAFVRMAGYDSPEELLDAMKDIGFQFYVNPEDRQRFIEIITANGMIRGFEAEYYKKDRSIFWILVNARAVKDDQGKIIYYEGIAADITARKRAEEALKKSERNLSDIVEFLPDATFVIDLDGKVIAWNRAIEEMTGIFKEEMIGQGDHAYAIPFYGERRRQLLDLIDRSDEDLDSKYKSVHRKGNTLYAEAFTPALYGGKGAHVWATGAPLFDDSGNRVGAIESIRDITDRKQAEEERLNRAEKMEALGTLAGGVAHDLNNVLGIVVGYSEMLLDGVDKSSPLRHGLENIMTGGLRAAAIVDDLLTLARRGVTGRSILNLNKIIADCQKSPEFTNLSAHHPAVRIKTDLDPDLLNISGSSVHLGKSLYNLLSNASEVMPKGGIVTIRTTNQYLDKPIQGYDQIREGDYVVLSVSDTGEGIQTTDLKRIFEPFYTKKVMGRSGTGLGLAVVWGTVKDHHGYINVESEEGKGSTFTLYFPVTREDITSEHIAVPVSEYMGKGESIMVVDDVKEQRDLAAGMLSKLNYNVASVSSGEEAIAYLKEHKIDLMVLDMIMDPGMDGLDTYRQVLEIHPKQKAIIVSGFSESDRVHAAKDLGAGAYVRKPYIKEKLGLAVKKELANL